MKKQFLAKVLALGLVLTMLPIAALAASTANGISFEWDDVNKVYVGSDGVYYSATDGVYTPIRDTVIPGGSTSIAVDPIAQVVTAEGITVENGAAVIKVQVVNGIANVSLSDGAVESLAGQVVNGKITLKIDAEGATKVSVSFPAQALAKLAAETGADLVIETPVATISIPNAALTTAFKDAKTVKVTAEVGTVTVLADNQAVSVSGLVVEFAE